MIINKSRLFIRAWEIYKLNNVSFGKALSMSWAIEKGEAKAAKEETYTKEEFNNMLDTAIEKIKKDNTQNKLISISTENEKVYLKTPYNADYVKEIKTIKTAKYNPGNYTWCVNIKDRETAINIIKKYYDGKNIREYYERKKINVNGVDVTIKSYDKEHDEYKVRFEVLAKEKPGKHHRLNGSIKANEVINFLKINA